ncbi:MAG: aldose epimerase family protein [Steroidobacter sp.]
MEPRVFGILDGQPVYEVSLRSESGMRAQVITWGAAVRDLCGPPRGERSRHLVLGLNTLEDYLQYSAHFGAVAGRFANRIANGRFLLDGAAYQLPVNDGGKHSLHGGGAGFGRRSWQLARWDDASVTLTLVSPEGDNGYPGAVFVTCTYRLIEPAILRVELTAISDAPTPLNLSHHSYFNLDGSPDILGHTLQVAADFYTPTDAEDIPTGEIRSVQGTHHDFREPRAVRRVDALGRRVCYDTNFVLRRSGQAGLWAQDLNHAATLGSSTQEVSLEVWTTEPGLQVYDGYKLKLPVAGLDGAFYGPSSGICLEPQHFPDSPNRAHFPNTILQPGRVYRQLTEYRFQGFSI